MAPSRPGTAARNRRRRRIHRAGECATHGIADTGRIRAPGRFREFVESDPTADDVVALAHRKAVVEEFQQLLFEPDFFEERRAATADGKKETVWQRFLEQNPWILGIGLAGQLPTSWNNDKLEQTVAGFSARGPGKRTDALQHHLTDLLCGKPHRPGCWAPSEQFAGGVTQVQQTVELARRQIGETLRDRASDGSYTGEDTYLLRPWSFLILGTLNQLHGEAGGVHPERFSSFELCMAASG